MELAFWAQPAVKDTVLVFLLAEIVAVVIYVTIFQAFYTPLMLFMLFYNLLDTFLGFTLGVLWCRVHGPCNCVSSPSQLPNVEQA